MTAAGERERGGKVEKKGWVAAQFAMYKAVADVSRDKKIKATKPQAIRRRQDKVWVSRDVCVLSATDRC